MTTASAGVFADRAIAWVRSAYPEGVPAADRAELIRVLGERLTHEEMDALVRVLPDLGDMPVGAGLEAPDPGSGFAENVTPIDRYRVAGRLAAGGWPLADIA